MTNQYPHGPIQDPRINAVIDRLQAARRAGGGGPRSNRNGGYVMNDNAEPDFPEYVRDPKNVFLSITLPLKGGTELCLKVA